jgi:Glucose-6-phosphate dehydrogenase subunit C-terminal domain
VVDSRKFDSERTLCEVARVAAREPLDVVDLSWLGISPLRGLAAALFDLDPRPLANVTRVRVASGVRGTQARGLLALGWLASRLGWRSFSARESDADSRRWSATRPDGGEVTMELVTLAGGAGHGVADLVIEAEGRSWHLVRDQRCIDVQAPDLPPRMQPARRHSDAELLQRALGPRGRDPIFREALGAAAQLVEAQGR